MKLPGALKGPNVLFLQRENIVIDLHGFILCWSLCDE